MAEIDKFGPPMYSRPKALPKQRKEELLHHVDGKAAFGALSALA